MQDLEELSGLPPRFGLIDASGECWSNLRTQIQALNSASPSGTAYKLFFLSRHGQGYHNVAEAKYGTSLWDSYWSKLNGDGEITWGPDPQLTSVGIEQAKDIRRALEIELDNGFHLPDKLYCSPLSRALRTCEIMFDSLVRTGSVMVIENCREENGEHTCDKRNTRTYIASTYPNFTIEDGFTEEDELWTPERETKRHVEERARKVLDTIFEDADNTFISVTAHGGFINAFLWASGRPSYPLPTGGVLPLVVKCEVMA